MALLCLSSRATELEVDRDDEALPEVVRRLAEDGKAMRPVQG